MSAPLLYPARCIFCGKLMNEDKLICIDCMKEKILVTGKLCSFCGVEKELCEKEFSAEAVAKFVEFLKNNNG